MRGTENGQLTLTIGKYYRVTGESTQHRGVLPDIELPSLVDTATVGESTRDTALPWDRIQPTRFRPGRGLDDGDSDAACASDRAHAANDPDFRYLVGDIRLSIRSALQKTVSLNLEKRKAENKRSSRSDSSERNERRAALGLEPPPSVDKLDDADLPETILLNEAARVAAEMVAIEHPSVARGSYRAAPRRIAGPETAPQ